MAYNNLEIQGPKFEFFPDYDNIEEGYVAGTAKGNKIAELTSSAGAYLAAAAVMLSLFVNCFALSISSNEAILQVDIENPVPGTEISFVLEDENGQILDGIIPEESGKLHLSQLEPDTRYRIVFTIPDETGKPLKIGEYSFTTDHKGLPPEGKPETDWQSWGDEPPRRPVPSDISTPTPMPTPTVTPTPVTTPEPAATPGPTPVITPVPTASQAPPASPEQTPEQSPERTPTTDPTPEQTPTTDPTPDVVYTAPVYNSTSAAMEVAPVQSEPPSNGSYRIDFVFDLNDGVPASAQITGEKTSYMMFPYGYSDAQSDIVTTAVNATDVPFTLDTANNTATVSYLTDSAYAGYSLTARLMYDIEDSQNPGQTISEYIDSDVFRMTPTFLLPVEGDSQNMATAVTRTLADGSMVADITITIKDIQKGTMPFVVDSLNIICSDDMYMNTYQEYDLTDSCTINRDGSITGIIEGFPVDETTRSLYLSHNGIYGHCYIPGEFTPGESDPYFNTHISETYFNVQIDLMDTYSIEGPAINMSAYVLRDYGLSYGYYEIYNNTTGEYVTDDVLSNAVAGDNISIDIYFSGTPIVNVEGLVPSVTYPDGLSARITPVTTDAYSTPYFTISFTMPARNVTAGDIVIGDLPVYSVTTPVLLTAAQEAFTGMGFGVTSFEILNSNGINDTRFAEGATVVINMNIDRTTAEEAAIFNIEPEVNIITAAGSEPLTTLSPLQIDGTTTNVYTFSFIMPGENTAVEIANIYIVEPGAT